MRKNLYSSWNYASVLSHYGLMGGTAVGAFTLLGSPLVAAFVTAAGVGLMVSIVKANKTVLENDLQEHPKSHKYSPNLQKMVDKLFRVSGLKSDKVKVYDFKPKLSKKSFTVKYRADGKERSFNIRVTDKKESALQRVIKEAMRLASKTHNAAAFNLGKPIVIISEPLLKLLSDKEEEAVLAHEFAHVAARHQHLSLPYSLLMVTTSLMNTASVLGTALMAGFVGVLSGIASGVLGFVASGKIMKKLHPLKKLLNKKESELSFKEKAHIKPVKKLQTHFSSVAFIGVVTAFQPMFLPVWVAAKGLGISASILQKSFSRSNEYQADKGAVLLGANPLALITALRKVTKIVQKSKEGVMDGESLPEPGYLSKTWANLNATHPTLDRRIQHLIDIAKKQGYSDQEVYSSVNGDIDISHADEIPLEVIQTMASRFYGESHLAAA